MEDTLNNNKLKRILNKIITFYNKIWQNHKTSFLVLCAFLLIVMLVLIFYPLCYDTIYNCYTDDVLQYYPYIVGFFEKIKHGELSLFDTSLLAGASFFSGVYYIPLDIFLGFAFLLSYIMPTEVAYSISNILRVVFGSMLLYYVFHLKGFKPKSAFIISIIYFVGGMTETFYIFPVYLGISFYVPLAMFIVDLCLHHDKKYFLLIPLYSVIIVLYDFYIAYMLFAFICIYFIIESHLSYNKFFLINSNFWKSFLYFMLMIFIGVSMSGFFLFPSSLYIINESDRAGQSSNDYLWLFGTIKDGSIKISFRHYFQQWANLFHPNTPHNLGLVSPGDYVREHASLYLTTGGALYLSYFFFVRGKKENRLKPWVILFNLLFCIPLFSMIFTFNEWPYVRWFFIPYMINFYAMALAMDKYDFKFSSNSYMKILPIIFMSLGLSTMLYVLIAKPEIYFHYPKTDRYFNPIVIGSIVFISILIILLLLGIILEKLKKNSSFIYRLIPFTIFAEAIFASVIAFSTIGSHNYLTENKVMVEQKNKLYELGYNSEDGYRINMFTKDAKKTYNASLMLNNVNHARFFQSFYNTPLKVYYSDIHSDPINGWSKVSMHGYTPLSGAQFNLKYVISDIDSYYLTLPNELYTKIGYYNKNYGDKSYYADYYELNEIPQFIVYDSVFDSTKSSKKNAIYNDIALLNHAYIKKPSSYETDDEEELKLRKHQQEMYDKVIDFGLPLLNYNEVYNPILASDDIKSVTIKKPDNMINNNEYFVYDFTKPVFKNIASMDMLYVIPDYIDLSGDPNIHLYARNKENDGLYPFHYNVGYIDALGFEPIEILVKVKKEELNKNSNMTFYGFNYDIYLDYLERQNEYSDRYFRIYDNKIDIKFKNKDLDKPKIVKTAYSYSNDWQVNEGYEICEVNGGFVGVLVPAGIENVSISLKFVPAGYTAGLQISAISCIIYLSIAAATIIILIKKRKRAKED